MHQVWHGVIDTLRLLPTIPPSSTKPTTEDERQKDLRQTLNEKKHLDEALEKLNLLISLRNNNDGQLSSQGNPPVSVASTGATSVPIATVNGASGSAVPIPIVSISTPTPSLSSLPGGGVKRKRKNSISASPAPMMPPNSADSALTSIASPLPTSATLKSATRDITPGRGGTPGNRELTGKQKKELYHDQLPLQPGRRVAAKPPPKTTATGAGGGVRTGSSGDISMSESGVGSGGDEEWILATIKKCIQGDKMRYEVQDADDVNMWVNLLSDEVSF
jgi:SAGA-associated factor 29